MDDEKTDLDAEVASPMLGTGVSTRKLVEERGALSRQLMATIFGTLMAVSDGMVYGWTSPFIPYLIGEKSHIKTTLHEAEWLETLELAGAFCALPITIYLVDKIGRKHSMLFAASMALLSWVLIGTGNKIEYLFVARFIAGLADDMCYVAAPMYVAEIADERIRGFLSSIIYIMMLCGNLIVYSVGSYAPYIVTPIIGGTLCGLQLLIFSFMPESPYFYLKKNREDKAIKSLKFFKSYKDTQKEVQEITKSIEEQTAESRGSFKDLFCTASNRKAAVILMMLNAAQHFAGISVMMMNVHLILDQAGSTVIDSKMAAIVFAAVMLASAMGASVLVDKFGRKVLLIISTFCTGICLLVFATYFTCKNGGYDMRSIDWMPAAAVIIYAIAFKAGLGLIPIVMTAELFPTNVKAIGMTLADSSYVLLAIVSIQMYQWLSLYYGLHVPFFVLTVWTFLNGIYIVFCIPETKGKTLEEIQVMLKA